MQKTQLAPVAHSGFPVRSLTRKLKGEGGEWITSYRVEQKKRFTTTLSHARPEGSLSRLIRPPANTREVSGSLTSRATVLNKKFLLHHCCVNIPSDLSLVSIRESDLERCVPEELAEFQNVIHVDAAGNKLALESFSHFPCLEGLELPLNGVVDAQLSPGDFPHLSILDLSYNTLSGLVVIDLGLLPVLRELHLTGNNLVALPVEMTRPYSHSDGGYSIRFPALERLWLDDNKLSDQSTFATLAGLRKLKYLNLDNNEFYFIPQLKLLGSSPIKQPQTPPASSPPVTQQDSYLTPTISTSDQRMTMDASNDNTTQEVPHGDSEGGTGKNRHSTETVTGEQQLRPELLLTDGEKSEDLNSSEIVIATKNSQDLQNDTPSANIDESTQQSKQEFSSSNDDSSLQTTDRVLDDTPQFVNTHHDHPISLDTIHSNQSSPGKEYSQPDAMSVAPFPELDTLSLVNNLILSAEGVLACESWPMFKKLLIYDNPFTATHKGLHPLLQMKLENHCGIKVVRKRASSTHKHHIGSKAKEFKKVSSLPPPPIPKCPLPAIEPPPLDHLKAIGYTPSVSRTHSSTRSLSSESSNSLGSVLDSEESEQLGVFMTQVVGEEPDPSSSSRPSEGQEAPTSSVKDDFEARLREVRERFKDVPDRYKGYEILLDVYDDPHTKIPSDINGCVRALSYALKHPRTLNSKPPAPISSLSSSSTTSQLMGNYLKKKTLPLEPLPQSRTHGKVREIRGVLEDIRSQATTIETNLSVALKPSVPKKRSISQLQRESKKLLAELQACYDRVRASSLRTTVTVDQERRGQGRRSGTPRRVQFSRDVQTLAPSSPRNTSSPRH